MNATSARLVDVTTTTGELIQGIRQLHASTVASLRSAEAVSRSLADLAERHGAPRAEVEALLAQLHEVARG